MVLSQLFIKIIGILELFKFLLFKLKLTLFLFHLLWKFLNFSLFHTFYIFMITYYSATFFSQNPQSDQNIKSIINPSFYILLIFTLNKFQITSWSSYCY